ncbi:hypothetical protein Tco_0794436 [Tanacetum coccineum]
MRGYRLKNMWKWECNFDDVQPQDCISRFPNSDEDILVFMVFEESLKRFCSTAPELRKSASRIGLQRTFGHEFQLYLNLKEQGMRSAGAEGITILVSDRQLARAGYWREANLQALIRLKCLEENHDYKLTYTGLSESEMFVSGTGSERAFFAEANGDGYRATLIWDRNVYRVAGYSCLGRDRMCESSERKLSDHERGGRRRCEVSTQGARAAEKESMECTKLGRIAGNIRQLLNRGSRDFREKVRYRYSGEVRSVQRRSAVTDSVGRMRALL